MKMTRLLTLALALIALQFAAAKDPKGPQESDEALIRRMEPERVDAGVRKDVGAVAAATAEDYLQIDLDGKVLDKQLQRIASSEFLLQSNTLDDMIVRVFGETAVVTGRSTPKGTRNGKIIETPTRYTRVYRKKDGQWKVIVFQMTRVSS
jgi:ketosteroid isomerase-like protein